MSNVKERQLTQYQIAHEYHETSTNTGLKPSNLYKAELNVPYNSIFYSALTLLPRTACSDTKTEYITNVRIAITIQF